MKELSWLKVVILSIAIIIAGYFVGNIQTNAIEASRSVEVKGLSEREVNADLAVWPIQITLAGNDLKTINETIEDQKTQVKDFFTQLGFSDNELNMGSTNIQDTRAQIYYGGNNSSPEYRYITQTDITIRTNDIEKLQKALDESISLLSKGIVIASKNTWQPIEYIFTGLNDIKPSMIEEATKNAREVAEKFAMDSNSKVGEIKSASQGQFSINDRDQNTSYIKVVRVVSTLEFFIED